MKIEFLYVILHIKAFAYYVIILLGCFCPSPRKGGIRQNTTQQNEFIFYFSSNEPSRVNLVSISASLMFLMIVSKLTTVGDLLNS